MEGIHFSKVEIQKAVIIPEKILPVTKCIRKAR
jgi:hypothetical protein